MVHDIDDISVKAARRYKTIAGNDKTLYYNMGPVKIKLVKFD